MPRSARRLLHTTVVLTVLGTLSVPGTAVSIIVDWIEVEMAKPLDW